MSWMPLPTQDASSVIVAVAGPGGVATGVEPAGNAAKAGDGQIARKLHLGVGEGGLSSRVLFFQERSTPFGTEFGIRFGIRFGTRFSTEFGAAGGRHYAPPGGGPSGGRNALRSRRPFAR